MCTCTDVHFSHVHIYIYIYKSTNICTQIYCCIYTVHTITTAHIDISKPAYYSTHALRQLVKLVLFQMPSHVGLSRLAWDAALGQADPANTRAHLLKKPSGPREPCAVNQNPKTRRLVLNFSMPEAPNPRARTFKPCRAAVSIPKA